jgi:hypothetical protein
MLLIWLPNPPFLTEHATYYGIEFIVAEVMDGRCSLIVRGDNDHASYFPSKDDAKNEAERVANDMKNGSKLV